MKRRAFITLLGGAATAWPLAVRAQQQTKIARIGILGLASVAAVAPYVNAVRAGLRDLGYVEEPSQADNKRALADPKAKRVTAAHIGRLVNAALAVKGSPNERQTAVGSSADSGTWAADGGES